MIPIHIITGFLGSGKTTFIKKLLLSEQGHQTIVLINELGEIGIDNLLVQTIHENTYLLPSGCMCCTVLTDLKETLLSVLKARNNKEIPFFDRIVIETTGMANPASVIKTIQQDTHLKGGFIVHGLSTIVDAENGILQSKIHPEWAAQIIAAQQVLLSKTDRVNKQTLTSIQQEILELYPDINLANV
ncbi:GTP-binding protein, partial [Acinetobacter baumannii]